MSTDITGIIITSWLISSFVIGIIGANREIGFVKGLIISLILSPLIGAIFVATSPNILLAPLASPSPPQETKLLIRSGNAKVASGDLDGAASDYEKVLTLWPKNPNTNFKLASIYSLKRDAEKSFYHLSRAVHEGFTDFPQILASQELDFLRKQPEFQKFALAGYRMSIDDNSKSDMISDLERLASLREKGVLTENEFEEQKKKLLAG